MFLASAAEDSQGEDATKIRLAGFFLFVLAIVIRVVWGW